MSFIVFQPYGLQTSIPLIGYRLSTKSEASTINGYHSLKLSTLDGMPRFALAGPLLILLPRETITHEYVALH